MNSLVLPIAAKNNTDNLDSFRMRITFITIFCCCCCCCWISLYFQSNEQRLSAGECNKKMNTSRKRYVKKTVNVFCTKSTRGFLIAGWPSSCADVLFALKVHHERESAWTTFKKWLSNPSCFFSSLEFKRKKMLLDSGREVIWLVFSEPILSDER